MCDFTHSSAASTAELSHVYGETCREGGSNPLIYSTSDPVCHLSFLFSHTSLSQTHKHTYLSAPYLLPPRFPHHHPPPPLSIPIRAHLAITSPAPPPQRNQFRLLLHTVMACWPREMESFQVLGYNLPPLSLPPSPSRCPLAASQHFLNTPGVSAG